MDTDGSAKSSNIEYFTVEVDGVRKRDQLDFAAAVHAAMEFRQTLPNSHIHVKTKRGQPELSWNFAESFGCPDGDLNTVCV